GVGDEIVDVDLAFHVPVHDLRNVSATARTAEGSTLPDAAGDALERTCGNFLARFCYTDDDRLAPAAMAAFHRLTHHVGIAGGVEGIVCAAIGQVLNGLYHLVIATLTRMDEVGHAEF